MRDPDNESVDPAVNDLLEFIKKSKRDTPLPVFKAQFLSGYSLPEEDESSLPNTSPASVQEKDKSSVNFG